jgi:hypothetical protein
MVGSGSTPLPILQSCHSCQKVDTPAPTSGIPLVLTDLVSVSCTKGVVSSSVYAAGGTLLAGVFDDPPPPKIRFHIGPPGISYPPTSVCSAGKSWFRIMSHGRVGCRHAGRPIPTRSHALSRRELAMRDRECSPPVSMMAGPFGGEGRDGSSEVVNFEKSAWRGEVDVCSRSQNAGLE